MGKGSITIPLPGATQQVPSSWLAWHYTDHQQVQHPALSSLILPTNQQLPVPPPLCFPRDMGHGRDELCLRSENTSLCLERRLWP